ncbi:MAG: hypothetical protein ACE5I3_15935, partial [Phycisphaerae bacterium]
VGELVQRSGTSGKLIWRARTARAISLPKAKRVARVLRVSLASLVVEPAATGAAELTVREAFVGQVGNDERDGNAESGK